MQKKSISQSGFVNRRNLLAALLYSVGAALTAVSLWFAAPKASAQSVGGAGGTFTAVGSMTSARFAHTATLLGNGTVLIAAGSSGSAFLNSAELFDPASGTFALLPNAMASARAYHTATLLPSGKVLITGGYKIEGGPTVVINTAELFDPASQTFTALSNTMTVRRYQHTATLLPNGKVLIAGGFTDSAPGTNTAELFDPASGTFTSLPTMTSPRFGHTATLLSNGKVLIAGGNTGFGGVPGFSGATNTAELFDPVAGTFTALSNTMAVPRWFHTATVLPGGKVMIAGGFTGLPTGTTNTAELFDPALGIFTPLGPMSEARGEHTATLLPSGKVLVAGGIMGIGEVNNTADLFDPTSGSFTLVSSTMNAERAVHTATLLPTGKILIAGGSNSATVNTAEVFDSSSGAFTSLLPNTMSSVRSRHTATPLPSGNVLLAGGSNTGGFAATNTAELFDPILRTFTLVSPMNTARNQHTATLLASGKVLVAGGYTIGANGVTPLNTAELFDPTQGTFGPVSPMTSTRYGHTATLLASGEVLVAGGYTISDSGVTPLNTAELFDPTQGTFKSVSPMNTGRYLPTATLLPSGKVLLAGGSTTTATTNTAELFDPASGTFTLVSPMNTARFGHTATLLPAGKVMVLGGFSASTVPTNTAEMFDPASGTFTTISPMTVGRVYHTATLLPSGAVLIAGGVITFNAATNTAELFDPASGTFTSLSPNTMTSPRANHTATLLPNGTVVIAGGVTSSSRGTNTAELFDPGLGFSDSRRPVTSTATDPLVQPASVVVTGTGFRGDSEASGSSFNTSATNYPILQLQRIDNDQTFFPLSDPATNWSDTAFTSATLGAVTPLPTGYYRVTIFTNAIPSVQKIIKIGLPVQLVSVVSRMTHGTITTPPYFDITFPLPTTTSPRGVECRSSALLGAGNYMLVFTFVNNLTSVANATVTSHDPATGTGSVAGSGPGTDTHQYIVNLTGVSTGQYITVTLNSVLDATGATGNVLSPSMGFLVGDVNFNGVVTNADVSLVKAQVASGAIVDSSNFRDDINANGVITNADVSLTKAQVAAGAQLPSPP